MMGRTSIGDEVGSCAGGGIGIHVRLRCVCRKAWRFKSSPAHKTKPERVFCFVRRASKARGEDLKILSISPQLLPAKVRRYEKCTDPVRIDSRTLYVFVFVQLP